MRLDLVLLVAGSVFGLGFQGLLSSNVVGVDDTYAAWYGS